MIAALYVDPRGPYPSIPGVECWDAERDARNYAGPWPVVAHPPCGPWSVLKGMCWKQDRSLAPIAVGQVRRWGGILEHPKGSELFWASTGLALPAPGGLPDAYGGFTIEVDQSRWGHRAQKTTWLYMVGIDPSAIMLPPQRQIERPCGGVVQQKMNSKNRHVTPPDFAEWLVALARTVKGKA